MRDAVQEHRTPLPPRQRKFKFGTTSFMLVMHVGAVFALLPRFWSWQAVAALAVLYWVTVLGVTLGLHRLVTHRSFVAPKWVERILVLMGALACQSGPIEWVGLHRHHHKFSDQSNDHHDAGRGLWWAHSGWMLHEIPALQHVNRLTGDLQKDPLYRWLDRWFLLVQLPLALGLYWYGQAAGVHGVIVPKDKSSLLNATASKVACGAAEVIPFFAVTNLVRTLKTLQEAGVWIYGAAGEATASIYQTDLRGPAALVMGSEGTGMRRLTRESCDALFAIPMAGEVSSLNVSVSAGICLFEAVRQRSDS